MNDLLPNQRILLIDPKPVDRAAISHVYCAFERRPRRFWFGHKLELAYISTTKEGMEKWLSAAWDRAIRRTGKNRPLHDFYRWCSSSLDNVYGEGAIGWPANAADIFYVHHWGYES